MTLCCGTSKYQARKAQLASALVPAAALVRERPSDRPSIGHRPPPPSSASMAASPRPAWCPPRTRRDPSLSSSLYRHVLERPWPARGGPSTFIIFDMAHASSVPRPRPTPSLLTRPTGARLQLPAAVQRTDQVKSSHLKNRQPTSLHEYILLVTRTEVKTEVQYRSILYMYRT